MATGGPIPVFSPQSGAHAPMMHGVPDLASQMHSMHLDQNFPTGHNGPKGTKADGAKQTQQPMKSSHYYEGWTIQKAQSLAGERKSWTRIEKSRMPFSEEDLAKQVKSKSSRKTAMDAFEKLTHGNQRAQINRLLEDCNKIETDPNRRWILASVEPVFEKNPRIRGGKETTRINVILRRNAKFSTAEQMQFRLGNTKGIGGGDIVDLQVPIQKAKPNKGHGTNEPHLGPQQPFLGHGNMHPQNQHGIPKAMPVPGPNHQMHQGQGFGGPPVPPPLPVPPMRGHDFPSMRVPGPAKEPNLGFQTNKRANAVPKVQANISEFDLDDNEDDNDDYPVQVVDPFRSRDKNPVKNPVKNPKPRHKPFVPPIDVHAARPHIQHNQSRSQHQAFNRPVTPPHGPRRSAEWYDSADDDIDSIFSPSNLSIGTPPSTPPSTYEIPRKPRSPRLYWDRRGSREYAPGPERHKVPRNIRGRRYSDQAPLPLEGPPYPRDDGYDIAPIASNHHHRSHRCRPDTRLLEGPPRGWNQLPFRRQSVQDVGHFDDFDDDRFADRRVFASHRDRDRYPWQ